MDQVRAVLTLAGQRGVEVALSADVASVLLRITNDASLLRPFPPWISAVEGVPLTDPVQQWCDLLDLGGDDRREAADRLRQKILH